MAVNGWLSDLEALASCPPEVERLSVHSCVAVAASAQDATGVLLVVPDSSQPPARYTVAWTDLSPLPMYVLWPSAGQGLSH